jgi:hypothetical protein
MSSGWFRGTPATPAKPPTPPPPPGAAFAHQLRTPAIDAATAALTKRGVPHVIVGTFQANVAFPVQDLLAGKLGANRIRVSLPLPPTAEAASSSPTTRPLLLSVQVLGYNTREFPLDTRWDVAGAPRSFICLGGQARAPALPGRELVPDLVTARRVFCTHDAVGFDSAVFYAQVLIGSSVHPDECLLPVAYPYAHLLMGVAISSTPDADSNDTNEYPPWVRNRGFVRRDAFWPLRSERYYVAPRRDIDRAVAFVERHLVPRASRVLAGPKDGGLEVVVGTVDGLSWAAAWRRAGSTTATEFVRATLDFVVHYAPLPPPPAIPPALPPRPVPTIAPAPPDSDSDDGDAELRMMSLDEDSSSSSSGGSDGDEPIYGSIPGHHLEPPQQHPALSTLIPPPGVVYTYGSAPPAWKATTE